MVYFFLFIFVVVFFPCCHVGATTDKDLAWHLRQFEFALL